MYRASTAPDIRFVALDRVEPHHRRRAVVAEAIVCHVGESKMSPPELRVQRANRPRSGTMNFGSRLKATGGRAAEIG